MSEDPQSAAAPPEPAPEPAPEPNITPAEAGIFMETEAIRGSGMPKVKAGRPVETRPVPKTDK